VGENIPKITTPEYKNFKAARQMKVITYSEFNRMMREVNHKNLREARAFMVFLYYSGARPTEITTLRSLNILKTSEDTINVVLDTVKKGETRLIVLRTKMPVRKTPEEIQQDNDTQSPEKRNYKKTQYKFVENPLIKEFEEHYNLHKPFPDVLMFPSFHSITRNHTKWKSVQYTDDGRRVPVTKQKTHVRNASKTTYWVKKWTGLPPYYFRHNRASQMAQAGASIDEISQYRGTTVKATEQYIHLTEKRARKISRYVQ